MGGKLLDRYKDLIFTLTAMFLQFPECSTNFGSFLIFSRSLILMLLQLGLYYSNSNSSNRYTQPLTLQLTLFKIYTFPWYYAKPFNTTKELTVFFGCISEIVELYEVRQNFYQKTWKCTTYGHLKKIFIEFLLV